MGSESNFVVLENLKLHSKSCYLPIETGHENTQANNQILGVN